MNERWHHPNGDAALDPVEFTTYEFVGVNTNDPTAVLARTDLIRLLEAAGYVPDERDAADFDETAWADDMGVAT